MPKRSTKNGPASIDPNSSITTSGRFEGYSWRLQVKANKWSAEIAEDQAIEPEDLPLVGFGCAGWLYESDGSALEAPTNDTVNDCLETLFRLFKQGHLTYLPSVSCSCSDL